MTRRFPDFRYPRPAPHPAGTILLLLAAVAVILIVIAIFAPKAHAGGCSPSLYALAQEHSNDMARRNHLDHAGFERRAQLGARAENVAYGYRTEAQTIAQWRRSPPHKANMRLPGCKAVAHACNAKRCYWTMEIGD